MHSNLIDVAPDHDGGARTCDSRLQQDLGAIARVLHRAWRDAEALGKPQDARVILHVAHLFADELTATDPHFDRASFIKAATDPSG